MRCPIPKRYLSGAVVVLFFFAVNVSLKSLTASFRSGQVINMSVYQKQASTPRCVVPPNKTTSSTSRSKNFRLYNWNQDVVAKIRISIWVGRLTTPLICGILSDIYGSRYVVLASGVTLTILAYLQSVLLFNCRGNWQIMMGYNLLRGMAKGAINPAIASFFGQWIPPHERTFIVSLATSGIVLGKLFDSRLSSHIFKITGNLAAIDYVFGSCDLVCCILWFSFCYSSPETHPRITDREKKYLREKLGPYLSYKKEIPYKTIFKSMSTWGLIVSHVGLSVATMITNWKLIDYCTYGLGYHPKRHYVAIVLPMLIMNIIWSLLVDYFTMKRFSMEVASARKISAEFGAMGAGIFSLTITYAECNENLVIGVLVAAETVVVIYNAAILSNALDIGSNYAGFIVGMGMTLFYWCRIMLMFWRPVVTDNNETAEWKLLFWVALGICWVTNIVFAVSCKGDPRSYNFVSLQKKGAPVNEDIELK